MINFNALMSAYTKLRTNPMELLGQYGISPDMANNPQQIIQTLLNKGAISQEQLNKAMEMRNNPIFQQMFGNRK